ncbi:MAG: hemin uptake protein HemP [Pirellulaceae bacterium]
MTEPEPLAGSAANSVAKACAAEPPAQATGGEARDSWKSEELLGEKTEVLIVHGSEVYRLRRTRQDKLILYK